MGNILSQAFWIKAPELTEKNVPNQSGRVHLITGGYSGVGLKLASILYSAHGTIWIAGRNPSKASEAIDLIKSQNPSSDGQLHFLNLDLSDLPTIAPAVREFLSKSQRLDVLHNNAGVMIPPHGSKTAQGFELQMGTNALGPFLLTRLLMPLLIKTAETSPEGSVRVTWAGSIVVDLGSPRPDGIVFEADRGGEKSAHEGQPAVLDSREYNYGMSKVANVYLCQEFKRRMEGGGKVLHFCFNPGNLDTELARHTDLIRGLLFKYFITYPSIYGAYTELAASCSQSLGQAQNGAYIVPWGQVGRYRPGVADAIEKKGKATKFWGWCDAVTKEYA